MPRPLAGFPTSWGNKRVTVMRIVGPVLYSVYTAPTTGGQDVAIAPAGGIKTADFAVGAVSDSGLYRVDVVRLEASTVGGVSVPKSRAVLRWEVISTGSQAGAIDLSAETVSILVCGSN